MNIEDLNGNSLKEALDADAARMLKRNKRANNTVSFEIEVLKGRKTLNIRGVYARDGGILALSLEIGSKLVNYMAPYYYKEILPQIKELIK